MTTVDELVPRAKVAKECGVSVRTIHRYEAQKRPGFDQLVIINNRGYHRRSRVEAVKILGNRLGATSTTDSA